MLQDPITNSSGHGLSPCGQHPCLVCDVDWDRVVLVEPEEVVAWLVSLHAMNEKSAIMRLFHSVEKILGHEGFVPGGMQWEAFEKTDLLGVLIDIVCKPGMFRLEPTSYEVCVHYNFAL